MSENAVLQLRKGTLHHTAPQAHRLCRGPLLHASECAFIQVPLHHPSRRRGATHAQRTDSTHRRLALDPQFLALRLQLLGLGLRLFKKTLSLFLCAVTLAD